MVHDDAMHIGDLARAAGCSTRAIRNYHAAGVLAEPPRDGSGYRVYRIPDIAEVLRIRALVDAGLPLRTIASLPTADETERRSLMREAMESIDMRITELERQRQRLQAMHDGVFGVPSDIRGAVLEVFVGGMHGNADVGCPIGLEDLRAVAAAEVASLELMAYAGVATDATWKLLRRNLLDESRRRASQMGARAWVALADVSARFLENPDSKARRLADEVLTGYRSGIFDGVLGTLREGDVPISPNDVAFRGAQEDVFAWVMESLHNGGGPNDGR